MERIIESVNQSLVNRITGWFGDLLVNQVVLGSGFAEEGSPAMDRAPPGRDALVLILLQTDVAATHHARAVRHPPPVPTRRRGGRR